MQSTPYQLPATVVGEATPGLTVLAGRAAKGTNADVVLRLLISLQHSNVSSLYVAISGLPPLTPLSYSVVSNHSVLVGGNIRVSATGELKLPQFGVVSPLVALVRIEGVRNMDPLGNGSRPLVGAIRWDAWFGDSDPVGAYVEKALAPQEWHYRLPFFAKEVSSSKVEIHGNSTAVMERELAYAEQYGIDYWAFVAYPPPSNMFYANALYLHVTKRTQSTRVKFCLIMDGNQLNVLEKDLDRIVGYFMLPTYQTVLSGRPLVFSELCIVDMLLFCFSQFNSLTSHS